MDLQVPTACHWQPVANRVKGDSKRMVAERKDLSYSSRTVPVPWKNRFAASLLGDSACGHGGGITTVTRHDGNGRGHLLRLQCRPPSLRRCALRERPWVRGTDGGAQGLRRSSCASLHCAVEATRIADFKLKRRKRGSRVREVGATATFDCAILAIAPAGGGRGRISGAAAASQGRSRQVTGSAMGVRAVA